MENNNIELEAVEQDLANQAEVPALKEYQKLLLLENDRKDSEKARSLIKFGCFEQKEEETLDFSCLELVSGAKAYKGAYHLYRNVNTYELLYVLPLVEDNKGDVDERTDLKPYAYDVIYLEQMDAETYKMVSQAAKRNLPTFVSRLYITVWVLYLLNIILALIYIIGICFKATSDVFATIMTSIYYARDFLVSTVIATPLLALLTIKYKNYKEEK
jgi:hypothetical protein